MKKKDGSTIFKYNYLVAALRKSIYNGEFGDNGLMPTEREISLKYKLSRVTVRAALKELDEEGLIERRHGSGTYVKLNQEEAIDEKLYKKKKFKVLFVAVSLGYPMDVNPYFAQILLGFHQFSSPGYKFDFSTREIDSGKSFISAIHDAEEYDGLIISYPIVTADIEYMRSKNIKFVCLGHPESRLSVPKVDMDSFNGIYNCVSHLIEYNRRKILMLYCKPSSYLCKEVVDGYSAALDANGVEYSEELVYDLKSQNNKNAESTMDMIIEKGIDFDAAIVTGDWNTLGAISSLVHHKRKIPQDVEFVYYGAFQWLLEGIKVTPSYVVEPFAKVAITALNMLCSLDDEPRGVTPQALVMPEFHQRKSKKIKESSIKVAPSLPVA